jgi:hypothetical protein
MHWSIQLTPGEETFGDYSLESGIMLLYISIIAIKKPGEMAANITVELRHLHACERQQTRGFVSTFHWMGRSGLMYKQIIRARDMSPDTVCS